MTCIDPEVLLKMELGELDESELSELERHLKGCPSCRDHRDFLAKMMTDLSTPLDGDSDDHEVFVRHVMTACARAPEASKRLASLVAFGAAAALTGMVMLSHPAPPLGREVEELTPRGSGALDEPAARVEAFVGKRTGSSAPALLEGAELRPGDGIVVRYSNPTDRDAFLVVLAIDSKNEVHWIHPAYLRESENPESIRLVRRTEQRVLDEIAEPDRPAPGALRVYAIVTDSALHVREVEAALAKNQGSIIGLFPEATLEEWSCTWQSQ